MQQRLSVGDQSYVLVKPVGYHYSHEAVGWCGEQGAAAGENDPNDTVMGVGGWDDDQAVDHVGDSTPGDDMVIVLGVPAPGGAVPDVDYFAQPAHEAIIEVV